MYTNSEIFCEKLLLLLVLCIGLSGPAHPPKVKYSVSKLLLLLVLCIGLSGPAHPPKVKYSVSKLLLLLLAFQDQHTLPKWNILGGCAGPERPIATITALRQNISLWEGVLVLKGQYIEQATITALRQNISLWEGVLVLKEVNCQKDVNCQIIKYLDYGGGSQKK